MDSPSRIILNPSNKLNYNKPLINPISTPNNKLFNSILYFDLDYKFIKSLECKTPPENEKSINIEEDINNNGCFLIKELIDALNSIDSLETEQNQNHKKIISNLILPFDNKNYEFYPKKYKYNKKFNMNTENSIKSGEELFNKAKKISVQKKRFNGVKERKGDWICQNCYNLNFAFRAVCNRCKGKKEECLQRVIE